MSPRGLQFTNAVLWWAGIQCGLQSILYGRSSFAFRHGLRLLFCPVDLWRYHEFREVLDIYHGETPVLDIGSPKLLAVGLARWFGVHVVSTDIVDEVGEECGLYGRLARPGAIEPRQCDARSLPFEDEAFPFAYSVSVLEHIADDGDTAAIREIARILAPGGRAVITVPLVPMSCDRWVDADPYGRQARNTEGKVFFSRYYDWASLYSRIVQPAGLSLLHTHVWQERNPGWYEQYCARTAHPASPVSILTKLVDPVWSTRSIVPVEGVPPKLTGHGLVSLVFQKDNF